VASSVNYAACVDRPGGLKARQFPCICCSPCVSSDGKYLAYAFQRTITTEPELRIVEIATCRDVMRRLKVVGPIEQLSWSPRGLRLLVGFRAGGATVVDLPGESRAEINVPARRYGSWKWSPSGRKVLVACGAEALGCRVDLYVSGEV